MATASTPDEQPNSTSVSHPQPAAQPTTNPTSPTTLDTQEPKTPGGRVLAPLRAVWRWTGFGEKKLWDILQLLLVPALLAAAGYVYQDYSKQRDEKAAEVAKQQDKQAADEKAYQDTWTNYLDKMEGELNSGLLTSKPGDKTFIIAQARTVTALQSLDPGRQHLVLQFLEAANLNSLAKNGLLYEARMSKAKLTKSDFSGIKLQEADLFEADLSRAILFGADLTLADLDEAHLSGADLTLADLDGAHLTGAHLTGAHLTGADLSGADLSGADLSGAHLLEVCLKQAKNLTTQQVKSAQDWETAYYSPDFRKQLGLPPDTRKPPKYWWGTCTDNQR